MTGKYDLKTLSNGEYHFNLKAGNGEVILSSERYKSKQGALNGIDSVRRNSPFSSNYENRTSVAQQPYFVLKAANGEIIGTSEMYSSVYARDNGIASVKQNGPSAALVDQTLRSRSGY